MEDLIAEVLRLVNLARVATGLPELAQMPKGVREDVSRCPIARALNWDCMVLGGEVQYHNGPPTRPARDDEKEEADHNGRVFDAEHPSVMRARAVQIAWDSPISEGDWVVRTPSEFRQFIQQFDRGHIPELVDMEVSDAKA